MNSMKKRPNILKLATKISLESLTYTGIGYGDPEYRILDPIIDDDMCEIMMHLRLEKPRTIEEVAKRAKKDRNFVEEQLIKLRETGAVRTKVLSEGNLGYFYPIWVPGIMEGILANREQCDKYPELAACFEEYTIRRLEPLAPVINAGDPGMFFMRVMPIMSIVKRNSYSASHDQVRTLVEKAKHISVGACSCRRSRRLMGEGCGHLEEDMCMYLNDNAVNYTEIGMHRMITKEEAYEILDRAEKNGLVHEINQTLGFDDTTAICNCCGCGCYALRIAEYFRAPNSLRSNFLPTVDHDRCVACGLCVETCQTDALKLGQKNSSRGDIITGTYDAELGIPWIKSANAPDFRENRKKTLDSGSSPCTAACPAHIPVQAYLNLAQKGRFGKALELIKQYNPFPAVCGAVCSAPCEAACTRAKTDAPLAINAVKAFLAEQEINSEKRYIPEMLNPQGAEYGIKVAVIGSGAAGLSAAYYLKIKGYDVTVFEKEEVLGGRMRLEIPEFRLKEETVRAEIEVLEQMGINFKTKTEFLKDIDMESLKAEGFKAVYLAVGAEEPKRLGIVGEDLEGTLYAKDVLKEIRLGKKPKFNKKKLLVIGSDDLALDAARSALRLGADVTLLCLDDELKAIKADIAAGEAEGVEIIRGFTPVLRKDGKKFTLSGDGGERSFDIVVKSPEMMVSRSIINALGLQINSNDGISVHSRSFLTPVEDIIAGGEAVRGRGDLIRSIADGKIAAESIHRYVHPGQSQNLGRMLEDFDSMDVESFVIDSAAAENKGEKLELKPADAKKAAKSFENMRVLPTAEEVKAEAGRCLGCGSVTLNLENCVGCTLCSSRCAFGAIRLEKVADTFPTGYFSSLVHAAAKAPLAIGELAKRTVLKDRSK